jgi:hypothetical protein
MAIPSGSNYPAALDTDSSLLADPADQISLTLAGDIGSGDLSFVVNESIASLEVPTMLVFRTGEMVFAEAKNDGTKTLSSLVRGAVPVSHNAGEGIRQPPTSLIYKQFKAAILAVQGELGVDPAGAHLTVAAALTAHDHDSGDGATIALGNISGHDKTAHDALNIDADTLDSHDTSYFATAGEMTTVEGEVDKALVAPYGGVLGSGLAVIHDNCYIDIPYLPALTITAVYIRADVSGSVDLDILKAAFPTEPTVSIVGSADINLSSVVTKSVTTLTGWTTSVAAGSTLRIIATNASSIKQLTVILLCTKV